LDGFLIAFLSIDEVIHIIRTNDEPKPVLMKKFKLSDTQTEAILDLKLRHLAKLEEIKIRAEQKELSEERDTLEKTLGSKARLKTLVRKELAADTEKFGDERMSPIVARDAAQAMEETEMVSAEPITVVLSTLGWIRQAKGHEIDAEGLNYKSGDSLLMAAKGKSTQQAVLLDSSGRAYSLAAHTLPSARSQGEPLTGRFNPPVGASFTSLAIGDAEQVLLLVSDAGYGFVTQLSELISRGRAGKAMLSVPNGARALAMQTVTDVKTEHVACLTTEGRLLVFPLTELPQLSKGKGNKIINIPSARVKSREEFAVAIAVLGKKEGLIIHAGKRKLTLSSNDLKHYVGERGRRGSKLPRGYQKVDGMVATPSK